MQILNRNNSGKFVGIGMVSPVNSDLAGVPGTEDLVVNLRVT